MDRVLNRNAAPTMGIIFLFAFLGFWRFYFSNFFDQSSWRFHFHGLTMISWCLLMVAQAYLIRTNKRAIHRQTGKLSYLVAPFVVISTILLAHYREESKAMSDAVLFSLAIPTTLLLQFTFTYGLAIYYRHKPRIHARYMICTALTMIPPIFNRILASYLLPPERAEFLPQIAGFPLYFVITDSIVDVILIALSIWDWKSRQKLNLFPIVLLAFVLFQSFTYVAHDLEAWKVASEWFLALPLS